MPATLLSMDLLFFMALVFLSSTNLYSTSFKLLSNEQIQRYDNVIASYKHIILSILYICYVLYLKVYCLLRLLKSESIFSKYMSNLVCCILHHWIFSVFDHEKNHLLIQSSVIASTLIHCHASSVWML
jgi:hypothetical protein